MNFLYRVPVLVTVALVWLSEPLMAADARFLSLPDAIGATLEHNPQLAGYALRQEALAGEQHTAALNPGFNIATQIEDIGGTDDYRWANSVEMTLALSSVVELGGKRDARMGVVSARQQQLASVQRVRTLDVLAAVTRQFITVLAAQEQLALQQEAQQLAEQTLASLSVQVTAARLPEAELLRANAALAQAGIAVQNAAQELRSERIRLGAYWANTDPDFDRVQADLYALAPAVSLAELLAQVDTNPDLELLASDVQLRAAELRAAQTLRDPNLQWNAGIRRLQSSSDTAFVVGASMPLGASQRASGAINAAMANQAVAELEHANARVQLQAEVMGLYEAHSQALAEVSALQTAVLPPLTEALAATAAAFDLGRYSYLELNMAQRQLLDARQSLIAAAARAHTLSTDIERLSAAALRADPALVPPPSLETP